MLNPLNKLLAPPSRATRRKLLAWIGGIVLAFAAVEITTGWAWSSTIWVFETLGPAGMAGVVSLGLIAALVAINMRS